MAAINFYQAMLLNNLLAPVGTRVGIRCGTSPAYTDSLGQLWIADTYSYVTTGRVVTYRYDANTIANTNDQELYYDIRFGDTIVSNNTVPVVWGYNVPVTPGNYTVKLLFAELFAAASRLGHIDINGVRKLTNFDEVAAAGQNTAYQMTFANIQPVGGFINVGITSLTQNFYITGLELVPTP